MVDRNQYLSKTKKIVIKVGSSLLTDERKKRIQKGFLKRLAAQIRSFQDKGIQSLVVTSGAIAAGLYELGLAKRPTEIAKLQALAAVGQSDLMHAYKSAFQGSGLKVAQILLTGEDFSSRQRYGNARNTLTELSRHKIVPVINENDTVAVEEIKFGNNDTLGALVTHLSEADLLVLLTDTDGLFEEDPRLNPRAKLVPEVREFSKDIERTATRARSGVGTGGMATKVQTAKRMMRAGIPLDIANGKTPRILERIMAGERVGTFFFPSGDKMAGHKKWLAWSVKPKGEVVVDQGAQGAILDKNKSLLPAGITKVVGVWGKGEIVRVMSQGGDEIARGVVNYSSVDLDSIRGLKSTEISQKLGYKAVDEAIHKDNLVKTEP